MSLSPTKFIISFIIVALGFSARGNNASSNPTPHPISTALQNLVVSGDILSAREAVKDYSIEELAALPDSILFDYYYLKAFINGEEGEETQKRSYLIAAKDLCEKSLGIHSPVYLEICWAIGDSFETDGDLLSAFEIYQAALIQSIGLYTLDDDDVKWNYETISSKVGEWYRNDELRGRMIANRPNLPQRDASKDAVQNDMEFYFGLYKDDIAKSLIFKADSLMGEEDWEKAAELYLKIADRVEDNPIAKATLLELAASNYINQEEIQKAESLLLRNLELLEGFEKSKVYRRSLSQLSNVYNAIHNYSKAKEYAGAAKYWYEDALDFSRGYILCLHRCATLQRGNDQFFLAMLMEDVAIQELYKNPVLGFLSGEMDSREGFLCDILSSAFLHYNRLGFRTDAVTQLNEAIDIAEANGFDASTYYGNLIEYWFVGKEYEKAAETARKAYEMSDSETNKLMIGLELGLSQFFAHSPLSASIISESSDRLQSLVNKTFAFTSMEERRNFWNYFELYFPLLNFLAYHSGHTDLYGLIYNNILVQKGLLLRTANNLRDMILCSGNLDDIKDYETMLQLRKQLPSMSGVDYEQAKKEIESIDKHLTREYSAYADYIKSNDARWQHIQAKLKDDDLAIEFYNIAEAKWNEDASDIEGKPRICAITLRKDYSEPHIIPLCTEERLLSISPNKLYLSDELYNLIWAPLEEELQGVKNIYFAADRELHKIAIEHAMMPDESIMGDHYNLFRLSSTRVLAENKGARKTEKAILYGGLVYDMETDDLIAESRNLGFHPSDRSRAFLGENMRAGFSYLPGTLAEVEKISQNFPEGVRMITGKPGTEESFKALAGTPVDIIHLATHGFFWTNEDAQENRNVPFLNVKNDQTSTEDWALIRSGLIFSGANIGLKGNTLPDDVEDGVLTALEISNMNLGQVDLVVMSACESGLGETSGEGVFGLQRGFKLAGANSLLMSLWKVDDDATQMLMTSFYQTLMSGQSKQQSLLNAQKTVREFSGDINGKHRDFSNPRYWAAFILLDALN